MTVLIGQDDIGQSLEFGGSLDQVGAFLSGKVPNLWVLANLIKFKNQVFFWCSNYEIILK